MPIEISPEHQKLIDDAIKSGVYTTPSQVVGQALERMAHEEELIRARRDFIREKIDRGIAEADRGEVIPGNEFLRRFEDYKIAYLAQNSHET